MANKKTTKKQTKKTTAKVGVKTKKVVSKNQMKAYKATSGCKCVKPTKVTVASTEKKAPAKKSFWKRLKEFFGF